MHKYQRKPKNFIGSSWTQMRLKMWPEMLIFCYKNITGTKHGLAEVRSST